jgi:ABC-type nickel/cobalt efflux system permease component RcnA
MKDFYNQLLSDTQAYLKTQYQLLQVRSIEQTSQLLGLIITLFAITAIVVIGLIFLAIALAAWLEQWLPMWASYLVIAGAMLLIALGVFWGRRLWFVRPIEKHLGEVILDNPQSLKKQKQALDSQSSMQRELLERDMAEVRRDWTQVQQIWQMIRGLLTNANNKDV